jgi:hypothetical protein
MAGKLSGRWRVGAHQQRDVAAIAVWCSPSACLGVEASQEGPDAELKLVFGRDAGQLRGQFDGVGNSPGGRAAKKATSRAGQQRGSAMGAHYRHTIPEMAARIATAIEQRLRLVLEVAEQALRPTRTAQHRECCSGHEPRFLANLWQMALRAGVEVALCLVELRGFEPLTSCMPSRDLRPHRPPPTLA